MTINQFLQTSLHTQLAPSQQPSIYLWGKKIGLSCLDTAHRQISNTTEEKFQDQ